MRTAILHIDGTDYELQQEFASTDDQAFQKLQEVVAGLLLRPQRREGLSHGAETLARALSGPSTFNFRVRRQDADVDLLVASGSVNVVAVYLLQTSRAARNMDDSREASDLAPATTDEGARWVRQSPWQN